MTTFFDTSAFVKRYVREIGSDHVKAVLAQGRHRFASRIVSVEATAAIARRHREGGLSAATRDRLIRRVRRDLEEFDLIELTPEIAADACGLARRLPLRAYDAVQLSSVLWVRTRLVESVRFVCADLHLAQLARDAGVDVVVPGAA